MQPVSTTGGGRFESGGATMDPKLVRLQDLQPFPMNAKEHDLGAIHTSIHEFGFLERIVVNETTGHILSGHGRLETLM